MAGVCGPTVCVSGILCRTALPPSTNRSNHDTGHHLCLVSRQQVL